jgi:1-acyl-sn-glycerol-3-phosphate acyltransferase
VTAGLLSTAIILVRSISATLRISISTVVDVHRGRYRRPVADARLRWWSERLLALVGLRCRVVDPHAVRFAPGRPTILMSNHQSLYDIPVLFHVLPGSIRMLTKKELFRVPIWGRGLRAGEFVSIDRGNHQQALRDLAAAREKMADGIVLWIAPEGTRSRDGRLGPLKKGGFMLALEVGATIVPIGIRGTRDVLPPKTLRFHLGRSVEVHLGAPIDTSTYGPDGREALMAEVERRLCALAAIEPRRPGAVAAPDPRVATAPRSDSQPA